MPLVSVAADESVEILEAQPSGPKVEGAGLTRLPVGHVVILAKPRGVPTVLLEHLRHRPAALRHYRVVSGEPRPELRDHTRGARVMVASGDQRRTRRRAKCCGVESVKSQAGLRQLVERRCGYRPAECTARAEAHVIGQDE